jgi:hypothetical protein
MHVFGHDHVSVDEHGEPTAHPRVTRPFAFCAKAGEFRGRRLRICGGRVREVRDALLRYALGICHFLLYWGASCIVPSPRSRDSNLFPVKNSFRKLRSFRFSDEKGVVSNATPVAGLLFPGFLHVPTAVVFEALPLGEDGSPCHPPYLHALPFWYTYFDATYYGLLVTR